MGVIGQRSIMGFTSRNKALAAIEERAAFLEHLLDEYPRLLKELTEKTEQTFKNEAEDISEGDEDVYYSTYNSFLSAFDENDFRKDAFYKAMILMVYSYYEGALEFLIQKTNSDDKVDVLCKANNIELSKVAKQAKDEIKSNIRHLRNHLAHNNLMSSKQKKHIERMSKQWPEIIITDDGISVTGSDFILDSLKKEKLVLEELLKKMGYKHKRLTTNK